MWSYIIDGALILIIAIFAIIGIAKGLLDSLLSLISTGLALVISIFTAKYVANFINKIFNFESLITDKLTNFAGDSTISMFGDRVHLSCEELSKFLVWIISVIIIFIIIKIVVLILAKIFEAVTSNSPTISGINRVLGMVFGIVKGCVWVLMLLALCSIASGMPIIGETVYNAINDTKITAPVFKYVDDFVGEKLTQDTIQDIVDRIIAIGEDGKGDTLSESEQALVGEYSVESIHYTYGDIDQTYTKTDYETIIENQITDTQGDLIKIAFFNILKDTFDAMFSTTISIKNDKTATLTDGSETINCSWSLENSNLTIKNTQTDETITYTVNNSKLTNETAEDGETFSFVYSKNA